VTDAVTAKADEGQEVDVWWGCYQGRTLAASFLACGALTAIIIAAAWYLWAEQGMGPLSARYSAYGLVALIWLFQLGRWGFRILVITYRLTNHRLFLERSFTCTPWPYLDLSQVTSVQAEQTNWERRLGVGRIRIASENVELPAVVLQGVDQPGRVAEEISSWAKRRRTRITE
jgi:hypothetical protein